jgi:ABC-type sugar transport system substrate-binding protein
MISVLVACAGAVLATASAARADDQSYLAYLNAHATFFPALNDSVRIYAGQQVCNMLHQGQTPEQIASTPGPADQRGIVDAARHELCPDTLH